MSNTFDEIDFEWVAPEGIVDHVEANWYFQAERDYNKGFGQTPIIPGFNTYRVDWTRESIIWSVNGKVFNKLVKKEMDENATRFPSTPSRIQFAVWQAVDNEWAGSNVGVDLTNVGMKIKEIQIIGESCGGGKIGVEKEISPGFKTQSVRESTPNSDGTVKIDKESNANGVWYGDIFLMLFAILGIV